MLKACMVRMMSGTGIMLSSASGALMVNKMAGTPASVRTLALRSGMACAIRFSSRSVSFTNCDIRSPVWVFS